MQRLTNALMIPLLVGGVLLASGRLAAETPRKQYVEALRQNGFADLAIDYLKQQLARPDFPKEEQPDIEFEIATTLIAASDAIGDLSKREQMLEEARAAFEEFAKKYPNHERRPESLVQVATIDLLQGRLRTVQAQLPANSEQARKLATEARQYFDKSGRDYEAAYKQLNEAYQKMPVFIADERPEDRALRKKKSELFEKYIEARFQAALARYFLADTYKSIELPPPGDPNDKKTQEAMNQEKQVWAGEYTKLIEAARKGFEAIYQEHRRELIGLYGHLWMARCMANQGDHRKAMGIYQILQEHQHPDLARFQREVFYFSMLSYAARGEHDQVVNLAEPWLRDNSKFFREPSYMGVQMELAKAYLAQGNTSKVPKDKSSKFFEANRIFERLAGSHNEYTGLARREQLKIAGMMQGDVRAMNFSQLFSLANAKLDTAKPELAQAERAKVLDEAKGLFRQAIAAADEDDDADIVNDARLSLSFAHLQAGETYQAAVLAEFIARGFPKSTAAPQAASYAMIAYQWAFEDSVKLREAGVASAEQVDLAKMYALADFAAQRWPNNKETDAIRLRLGYVEFSRQNHEAATGWFDKVNNPRSPEYSEALSMAGVVYWDWYRTLSQVQGSDQAKLKEIRAKAADRLAKASPILAQIKGTSVDRVWFVNDAVLAEAYFEAGQEDLAVKTLAPFIALIEKPNVLPESIEPQLRINALTIALQCYVNQSKFDEADKLVKLITDQKGQEQAGSVTLVLVQLASRLKDQLKRLETAGDQKKHRDMQAAFEKFLERIAGREAGQNVQTLVFLGNAYVEIGQHQKAVGLLEKAIGHPDATAPDNQQNILQARLLLARSYKDGGNCTKAVELITQLMQENATLVTVIMERGYILEACGQTEAAIGHWKRVIGRMQQNRPRPDEFYQSMDRLIQIFKSDRSEKRKARLQEGLKYAKFLLNTDVGLPAKWKASFEKHVQDIEPELPGS